MKKVLLITDVDFWVGGAGHRARIAALVSFLAKCTDLYVVFIGTTSRYDLQFLDSINYHFFIPDREQTLSPLEYGQRLQAYLEDKNIDSAIIEYIHLSYLLNFLDEKILTILDAHDIISERSEEFKKFNYGGLGYEISAVDEMNIYTVYDHVMVLCEPDYERVKKETGVKVLLCPHFSSVSRRAVRKEVKNIVYIASEYLPNVDAINFFIKNCWDAIVGHAAVDLLIYGNVVHRMEPPVAGNIFLKGFIKNIDEAYDKADIIINPVRFGAGLKIKNMEALANGIPLITTAHGGRGLEKIENKGYLVANGAREFIDKIALLIENVELREQLGLNAVTFISETFSEDKCFAPLLEVIHSGR